MNIQQFAKEIHAQNVAMGWWNKPNPCIQEKLMLTVKELAEGCEGLRKDLMDDHLPHRKMIEVELADALIRLLDLGEYLGLEYSDDSSVDGRILSARVSPAGNLMAIVNLLSNLSCEIDEQFSIDLDFNYSVAIMAILEYGRRYGHNIMDAAREKVAYNKTRADHQLAARNAPGGKAF